MAGLNMFETAAKVPAKAPSNKRPDVEVGIVGLEDYAQVCVIEKSIKSIKETLRVDIDDQVLDWFTDQGMKVGRHPDNFKGVEGLAKGSCEVRKRSSASGLDEVEQALLSRHNIPTQVVSDRPDTFIINPAYADLSKEENKKLLEAVSAALAKVKGLPEDFLLKQEATTKVVTTDASLNEVYKASDDAAVVKRLLSVVGVAAVKPSVRSENPIQDAISAFSRIVKVRANEAKEGLVEALRKSAAMAGAKA
jgi:hypothetical protein